MRLILAVTFSIVCSAYASEYKLFFAEKVFEAEVKNPSKLSVCGDNLWTLSVEKQNLAVIDLKTKNQTAVELPKELHRPMSVTSLSCFLGRVLILVKDKQSAVLLRASPDPSRRGFEKLSLPPTGRIFDLFCDNNNCGILAEKGFFRSGNLITWKKMEVPKLLDMDLVGARPDMNPFEHWQDSLVQAQPFFLRGAFLPGGEQMFLDGLRAQFGFSHMGQWRRWGKFGAWEGSLYAPRAFAVGEFGQVFVADAQLKAIFVFKLNGQFLGSLSLDQKSIYSPKFVQGITIQSGIIYVADFFANRIYGFRTGPVADATDPVDGIEFRQNLFRRPDFAGNQTPICVNCHDGTQSDFLHRFAEKSVHGPEMCAKCHDPHHTTKSNHYLRSDYDCVSCHQAVSKPLENHVWGSKGGACLDCHAAHSVLKKALKQEASQLCVRCHSPQNHQHRSVEVVLEAAKTNVTLENGQITCLTCHSVHHQKEGIKFLSATEPRVRFCASCHGDRAAELSSNFHARWKKRGHE